MLETHGRKYLAHRQIRIRIIFNITENIQEKSKIFTVPTEKSPPPNSVKQLRSELDVIC